VHMGDLERERWRCGVEIYFADWIMTCRVLCCYSRLHLQTDARFTAAHKQREQAAAPTYALIFTGLSWRIQGLRSCTVKGAY